MKAEQLRALQAPLKEKYKRDPSAAMVTLKAEGNAAENLSCRVETGRALLEAGLHSATGGDGTQLCSGDLLLQSLVACAGVTLRAVATAIGVLLNDAHISAEGDLDFRGTLGVAKDVPVGFRALRLNFQLKTDATEEKTQKLIELTERYCVVLQTLRRPADIKVTQHVIA